MQKKACRACAAGKPTSGISVTANGASPLVLGAMGACRQGAETRFYALAPAAKRLSLCGDFNGWRPNATPMERDERGVWQVTLPTSSLPDGSLYKLAVEQADGRVIYKSDPYAACTEPAPGDASCLLGEQDLLGRETGWEQTRRACYGGRKKQARPLHIYEADLATWRHDAQGKPLSYAALGFELIPYVKQMGYTHALLSVIREGHLLSPVTEQGSPRELRELFDSFHEAGIGVLLSLPLARLPLTEGGLERFDGTPLYESANPSQAKTKDGCGLRLDLTNPAAEALVTACLRHWIEGYGIDGFLFDDLSVLLDGNDEATAVLKRMNASLQRQYPYLITVAESTNEAELGFSFCLDPAWHTRPPSAPQASGEPRILPLSTLTRGSLLSLSEGQRLAAARVQSVLQLALPGKKQTPMGWEIGQTDAWNPKNETNWFLTEQAETAVYQFFQAKRNHFYLTHSALWEKETAFEVLSPLSESPVLAYRRGTGEARLLLLLNPHPTPSGEITLPVWRDGVYRELLRTDQAIFGGDGRELRLYRSKRVWQNGKRLAVLCLSLPPTTAVILQYEPSP